METGSITKAMDAVPELKLKYQTASQMLDNPGYMGDWHGIKLPPYLTPQEFQRVQDLRIRVTRKSPCNRTYIFSGLIVCGECGRRMTGHPSPRPSGACSYSYYCQGSAQRKGCNNGNFTVEWKIEDYLLSTIDEQIQIKLQAKPRQGPKVNQDVQLKTLQKKLSKLSELYIDDMISKADYSKKYAELTSQMDEITKVKSQSRAPEEIATLFSAGWQEIYKQLNKENKQAFWKLKIKEIRLYKDRRIEFDFL